MTSTLGAVLCLSYRALSDSIAKVLPMQARFSQFSMFIAAAQTSLIQSFLPTQPIRSAYNIAKFHQHEAQIAITAICHSSDRQLARTDKVVYDRILYCYTAGKSILAVLMLRSIPEYMPQEKKTPGLHSSMKLRRNL